MERIVDFLAEEEKALAVRVKMTLQQKHDYAIYRKACRAAGVEPTRADFLTYDIPSCVTQVMGWVPRPHEPLSDEEFELRLEAWGWSRRKAKGMGASVWTLGDGVLW